MRIDDTRGPNLGGGPEGPGGSTPTGNIGRWSGHVAPPVPSRLPAETPGSSVREPLRDRAPLHAAVVETATLDNATIEEMESLHDWLLGSDAHVESYVDGVLMSSMLKDVLGQTAL